MKIAALGNGEDWSIDEDESVGKEDEEHKDERESEVIVNEEVEEHTDTDEGEIIEE